MTELPMPHLLGICGRMQSGKDTLGEYLVREQDYRRMAFADKVKEAVVAFDPLMQAGELGGVIRLSSYRMPYETPVELCNRIKNTVPELRRAMQAMGDEVGRQLFGPTFWIDQVLVDAQKYRGRVVITDVRYPNEADAIKAAGGYMMRITRPGLVMASNHPSESMVDECKVDYEVVNDGTLEQYLTTAMMELTP